jgi:hypothetical protein
MWHCRDAPPGRLYHTAPYRHHRTGHPPHAGASLPHGTVSPPQDRASPPHTGASLRVRSGLVISILCPCPWIIDDILPNTFQRFLVADNMIVEPALPGKIGITRRPYSFRADRFDLAHDRAHRSGHQPLPHCRDAPPGRLYRPGRLYGVRCVHDDDNTVQVVGHDHPFIQNHVGSHLRRSAPFLGHNLPGGGQDHFAIRHVAEKGDVIPGAHGHKIPAGCTVIPAGQPRRFNPVSIPEFGHPVLFLLATPLSMLRSRRRVVETPRRVVGTPAATRKNAPACGMVETPRRGVCTGWRYGRARADGNRSKDRRPTVGCPSRDVCPSSSSSRGPSRWPLTQPPYVREGRTGCHPSPYSGSQRWITCPAASATRNPHQTMSPRSYFYTLRHPNPHPPHPPNSHWASSLQWFSIPPPTSKIPPIFSSST